MPQNPAMRRTLRCSLASGAGRRVCLATRNGGTVMRTLWLRLPLILFGCGGGSGTQPNTTSVDPTSGGAQPVDSSWGPDPSGTTGMGIGTSSGSSSSEGGPPSIFDVNMSLDVNSDETGETGEPRGCEAIDFVFVVDDSSSLLTLQQAMIDAVPALFEALATDLPAVTDMHIGVVTTDAYVYNDVGCSSLGALVTRTGGVFSSNGVCGPYAGGFNFMTLDDDLATAFGCAALVGTSGDPYERPMAAMLAATDETHAAVCNEGFIREQALGVVVVVTDEWDGPGDPEGDGSPGTPESWLADLVATKGDDETRFVVGLVVHDGIVCGPPDVYSDPVRMLEFAEGFTHSVIGGICLEDYTPFVEDLADEVVAACNAFDRR